MNQTRTCRTCGFADCPGANGGNCPRWPAREAGMFDQLTSQENTALWTRLANATRKLSNYRHDLPDAEWRQVADTEIDIIDLRDDLTASYGKLRTDA